MRRVILHVPGLYLTLNFHNSTVTDFALLIRVRLQSRIKSRAPSWMLTRTNASSIMEEMTESRTQGKTVFDKAELELNQLLPVLSVTVFRLTDKSKNKNSASASPNFNMMTTDNVL